MRVYNFSAGPAALPLPVLQKAQSELVEYQDAGMSVMEMSHRSKAYMQIISQAESALRELMNIPQNYKVLFLQGGASLQFSMVPMNLHKNKKADYAITGAWSKKAMKEGKKISDVKIVSTSEEDTFSFVPKILPGAIRPDADFFHMTSNNTIYGTRYPYLPDAGNVPIVSDMSSFILSETINVADYGIIYAGAQKNIGPSGVTVVIIRDDLIGGASDDCPSMLNYQIMAENDSLYNTPPTYSIYMAMLGFQWLQSLGGVAAIEKINIEKANLLYDCIDNSSLYSNPVAKEDRSRMNVTFVTGSDELDAKFIKEAASQGLCTLKGHRSVGGMRASIYNAMPQEGVQKLVDFMKKFESDNK